ncbi:hypothetical protein E2C01_071241 [Portunus trituberculatus]|uniref:Uncharacterized protein n=1 Tax=Portunus trituberculatus TaxID=210409 RepID=A0A5B7I4M9_PORTR|nr:hypothetical protein [Portunus trituberculatus]
MEDFTVLTKLRSLAPHSPTHQAAHRTPPTTFPVYSHLMHYGAHLNTPTTITLPIAKPYPSTATCMPSHH